MMLTAAEIDLVCNDNRLPRLAPVPTREQLLAIRDTPEQLLELAENA